MMRSPRLDFVIDRRSRHKQWCVWRLAVSVAMTGVGLWGVSLWAAMAWRYGM